MSATSGAAALIAFTDHTLELVKRGPWTDEQWDEHMAKTPTDPEWTWLAARDLEAARQDLQRAEAALTRRRLTEVEENGAIRLADTWVTTGPKTTRKLLDPDALVAWVETAAADLEANPTDLVADVWRLTADNLRISTLRALAARLYAHREPGDTSKEGPAEFTRMVEDTFIETTREETGTLKEIPIDKAPKYAQAMEHGHRAGSFNNKRSSQ